MVDGRVLRGERTRVAVVDAAIDLAIESGLDGLSLGQLADRLGVSKSGLFAHWSSKEALQLATIDRCAQRFTDSVVRPALKAPRGLRRLWALHECHLADIAGQDLGGCFFKNTQFEFNSRPGAVRDRLVETLAGYHTLLERLIAEAIELGELDATVDPRQLSFEMNAVVTAAVYETRLLDAAEVLGHARAATLQRLRGLTAQPDLLPKE
jgi:AcrR family transcriptional regulator